MKKIRIFCFQVTTQVWKWLDLATGKWSLYLPNNNKLINEAYWRGDREITITSGRRRYNIDFSTMVQVCVFSITTSLAVCDENKIFITRDMPKPKFIDSLPIPEKWIINTVTEV